MKDRAKQVAKYYNQCKLPKWATVLGVVLQAFGIVVAGVTAIFHDKYSSIFGEWESALTNVWFMAFIALVGVVKCNLLFCRIMPNFESIN